LREEPQRIEAPYYPGQRAFNESKTALFRPSWSPDGRLLAFARRLGPEDAQAKYDIWVLPLDP